MKNLSFTREMGVDKLVKLKENSWNGKDYRNLENFLTDDIDVIN